MSLFQFFSDFFRMLFPGQAGVERPSPKDRIRAGEISYDPAEGVIHIDLKPLAKRLGLTQNPLLAQDVIPNTNSMDPMIDANSNTIPIYGATPEDQTKIVADVGVGDIAIYEVDGGTIIHQIWEIKDGLYTFRGINNANVSDKPPVTADRIAYLSLGVIN